MPPEVLWQLALRCASLSWCRLKAFSVGIIFSPQLSGLRRPRAGAAGIHEQEDLKGAGYLVDKRLAVKQMKLNVTIIYG